ncbi:hypothetical protein ACTMTI_16515 [Nonomuraea sp. H19]|uniref:hypothetical protein n=1 Tax=Nonomuraea sp. H19 TaxID=3452206 RepID=UPI003F8BA9CF
MPGFERYALARARIVLDLPGWDTGMLLDAADRISGTGDVLLQRRLFAHVEAAARAPGTARCWTHGARTST